jgi:hypothetical protein
MRKCRDIRIRVWVLVTATWFIATDTLPLVVQCSRRRCRGHAAALRLCAGPSDSAA